MMNTESKSRTRKTFMTREDIQEIATNFQKSRCLLTAFELGIFSVLGGTRRTSGQVARSIEADRRATDRLMNALSGMGLLVKKRGKFSNTPAARKFLVKGSPGYMAGLQHTRNLWETWSTLTSAVRRGTRTLSRRRGRAWLTSFIAAMHDRACREAQGVASRMDLQGVRRLLDVGGGSGAYAMAFVRAQPGLVATVFDLPEVVPLTRSYIRRENLSGRVETVAGDYMKDDLGEGYDMVFLSAIIHSNPPRDNQVLIGKCARALTRGGRVVVQDFIVDEARTHPPRAALFSLNMLVGTKGGDTYTYPEVRSWMKAAGFSRVERVETSPGTTQISGRKA